MSAETEIREVLSKIDAAWRKNDFDGLERCFHEQAVIVGPGYVEYAIGQDKCAESYREFAANAAVSNYSEEGHRLRIWGAAAVYTFKWRMTYRREGGEAKLEQGSDQFVLQHGSDGWQVAWRYVYFQPGEGAA